jgi:hypothetical protein
MESNSEINEEWLEEIIRETEHYYKGEMQQEERASWLLGTASALLAIFLSLFISNIEKEVNVSKVFFFIPLCAFFISAVFAVLGLIPYNGTKGVKILAFGNKTKTAELSIDEFIKERFRPDDAWSGESLKKRILYHFRSHYLRNFQKSQQIIWSARFLLIGLFTSLFMVWNLIG